MEKFSHVSRLRTIQAAVRSTGQKLMKGRLKMYVVCNVMGAQFAADIVLMEYLSPKKGALFARRLFLASAFFHYIVPFPAARCGYGSDLSLLFFFFFPFFCAFRKKRQMRRHFRCHPFCACFRGCFPTAEKPEKRIAPMRATLLHTYLKPCARHSRSKYGRKLAVGCFNF